MAVLGDPAAWRSLGYVVFVYSRFKGKGDMGATGHLKTSGRESESRPFPLFVVWDNVYLLDSNVVPDIIIDLH